MMAIHLKQLTHPRYLMEIDTFQDQILRIGNPGLTRIMQCLRVEK